MFKGDYNVGKGGKKGSDNMKSKDLEEIREDGREFAELIKKIPKERKNEALRLLEGFALCAEHMCRKAG